MNKWGEMNKTTVGVGIVVTCCLLVASGCWGWTFGNDTGMDKGHAIGFESGKLEMLPLLQQEKLEIIKLETENNELDNKLTEQVERNKFLEDNPVIVEVIKTKIEYPYTPPLKQFENIEEFKKVYQEIFLGQFNVLLCSDGDQPWCQDYSLYVQTEFFKAGYKGISQRDIYGKTVWSTKVRDSSVSHFGCIVTMKDHTYWYFEPLLNEMPKIHFIYAYR